jgi:flavin-dependent dehydrogenase
MGTVEAIYDVAVVGAGPAGGHLARLLAGRGLKILLLDRLVDLQANAFSSAGTVMETMTRFNLPDQVVGSEWRHMEVRSSREVHRWQGKASQGTVLDFGLLRRFLADASVQAGAHLALGCQVTGLAPEGATQRLLIRRGNERLDVRARLLVDATGPARSLMRCVAAPAPEYLHGVGLEYLVEVPAEVWEGYRETLGFFLGSRWMPRGYSWIFPMQPGLLKVGAGRYTPGKPSGQASLKPCIERLLGEILKLPAARVLDVHGGVLRYARGLQDPYAAGAVLAVGDAVSTLNPLGGEGIRHAMEGAEIALPFLLKELETPGLGFTGYPEAMQRRFRRIWLWSEELAARRYLQDSDDRLDRMVRFLAGRKLEFVVDILFGYNFVRAARSAGPAWLWSKLRRAVRGAAGLVRP